MLKAIETRYKGYRFRSRLEARWAVFFDALGLRWEYEAQGYNLGEAGYYLPDFWLPDLQGGTFIEVKPQFLNLDELFEHDDFKKWQGLVHASGFDLVVLDGTPSLKSYLGYIMRRHLDPPRALWQYVCFQSKYLPPINHDHQPRLYMEPGGHEDADCKEAVEAARSARFEHGEAGA